MSRVLAVCAVLLLAPAGVATASTVGNNNDPTSFLVLVPTNPAEANSLTIAYADAAGAAPSGYTVHDTLTDVTLGGTCAGCTHPGGDPKTAFVPAQTFVQATTGDTASTLVITGQESLPTTLINLLTGGADKDSLTGGAVHNDFTGGGGNDTLIGGVGGDFFESDPGDDTATGNGGGDQLLSTDGDGADTFTGGPGVDIAAYSAKTAAVTVTEDGVANDGVALEGDNVTGIESVAGTSFNDSATLTGTTPAGIIGLGGGDDTLVASSARETITSSPGNDKIDAGGGGDTIDGGPGDDTINGGPGDDFIIAGTGNDTVDAGAGKDTFVNILDGDGADRWTGGPGEDDISYASVTGPVSVTEDGVANDGAEGEGDNVMPDIETIRGSLDSDTITGSSVDNTITGGGGLDTIDGGAGNDYIQTAPADSSPTTLIGGDGADSLQGGAGDDLLDGGPGDDVFDGYGGGADVFKGGTGTDAVTFAFMTFLGTSMSPNGLADDGRPGQGANIGTDVENLTGTVGPDTITGAPGVRNRIDGFGGGDRINVFSDPADTDTVLCRAILGGFGRRAISGTATQNDIVNADVLDRVSTKGTTGCSTVHRPSRGPKAVIGTKTAMTTGRVFTVSFHCLSARPSCRISAQAATLNGSALDHGRVVIASGKTGQILFHLTPIRQQLVTGHHPDTERITAEVTDSTGITTTVARTIRIRLAS